MNGQMSNGNFIASSEVEQYAGNSFESIFLDINYDIDNYVDSVFNENFNSTDVMDGYPNSNMFQYLNDDIIGDDNKEQQNETNKLKKNSRKKKEKIILTPKGKEFRDMFYHHLHPNHKKIRKEKVQSLYNNVCDKLKLPKMNREEIRSINKFFNNFAYIGVDIIKAIKSNNEKQT